MNIGDPIEFKPRPGLGAWKRGTVVAVDGKRLSVVDDRGDAYEVAAGRTRKPRQQARAAAARAARTPASLRGAHRDVFGGFAHGSDIPTPPHVVEAPTVRAAPEALDALITRQGAWRSNAYLAFVRARPCCSCGAPGLSDPSHHGRRALGRKTDDHKTIPLCRAEHDRYHNTGRIGGRTPEQTQAFINATIVDLVGEFLKRHAFRPLTEDELVALAARGAVRRSA